MSVSHFILESYFSWEQDTHRYLGCCRFSVLQGNTNFFVIIPVAEMPTSGDLKSGNFFWSSTPRPNSPMRPPQKKLLIYFYSLPPPPPPPHLTKKFRGKNVDLSLSGTSSGWILIQSDYRLYRSNEEESLFLLFATSNVHDTRKWSEKP